MANYALGYTALCMGNLTSAREYLAQGILDYLPTQRSATIYRAGQDPGVACRSYLAMTEWLLGFPDRARNLVNESVALAEELDEAADQDSDFSHRRSHVRVHPVDVRALVAARRRPRLGLLA